MARPGRLLVVVAAALLGLRYCFVAGPAEQPKARSSDFNPTVAASAALPALTMLAEDAEAKYGDQRKFAAVLVPLTTLVFPAVAMGMFVLYSFQEDAFWRLVPGTKRARELEEAWKEHPLFANSQDPLDGLINPDDYEAQLCLSSKSRVCLVYSVAWQLIYIYIYLRASGSGRQPQRRMARLQMSGHYAYPAVRSDVTPAPHFCPRATAAGSLH